jgi:hypothetical protein
MLWMEVTEEGSTNLSGTLRCVTHTTQSAPRTAMAVNPLVLTALKAYSAIKLVPIPCECYVRRFAEPKDCLEGRAAGGKTNLLEKRKDENAPT